MFQKALDEGFLTVAHAGEEGPAQNIRDSLSMLGISRIDHGVRCVEDEALVTQLMDDRTPLTVCPLSNTKLKVFEKMKQHNIVDLLRRGLCVTINSDDPAFFGGYMNANFHAVADAHTMTLDEVAQFTLNGIEASFISDNEKAQLAALVDAYMVKE